MNFSMPSALPCICRIGRASGERLVNVIFLPMRPEEEKLPCGHYIVAMKTVEGRGVTSQRAFDKLLFEDEQKEARVA